MLDDDDVVALDIGADFFLANGAVLRRPVGTPSSRRSSTGCTDFYAAGPGVGWMLLSAWPIPPIDGMGLIGHPPFMVRAPGGEPPPLPPGLTVREARTEADLADFSRALEGYPASGTEVFADARLLDVPGLRIWVGYLDGRPVACAGAHVTEGCVDVEFVAAHADVRGRGFGAAVTWARRSPTRPSRPCSSRAIRASRSTSGWATCGSCALTTWAKRVTHLKISGRPPPGGVSGRRSGALARVGAGLVAVAADRHDAPLARAVARAVVERPVALVLAAHLEP